MTGASILLVEDEFDVMNGNRIALELEGYRVLAADTLAKGRELVEREHPDLIVLDILLPDGNGLAYCQELRGKSGVRILFLSALNTKEDAIAGLRMGGDDYIAKPYLMDELLIRIETLLRRGKLIGTAEAPLRIGALEISSVPRMVRLNGQNLQFTPTELILLETLLRKRDQYIRTRELYERVWGMEAIDTRPIKQHIRNMRSKLGDNAPVAIESIQGKGYRIIKK